MLDLNSNVLNVITSNMLDIAKLRDSWGKDISTKTNLNSDIDFRKHITWQITGDKKYLESYYTNQIKQAAIREYINTEGNCWIDRVYVAEKELQRSRLGGVELSRNQIYPGNTVSWRFEEPANGESVAVLIPFSNPSGIKIETYNLEEFPVEDDMAGWDVLPGKWEVIQRVDANNDVIPDKDIAIDTLTFERSKSIQFHFPPRQTALISLRLLEKDLDYSQRFDLGIGAQDIKIDSNIILVKVHNIGAVDSPPVIIALMNQGNEIFSKAQLPAIKAPIDLLPKTAEVVLSIPETKNIKELKVMINPDEMFTEITRINNEVYLKELYLEKY